MAKPLNEFGGWLRFFQVTCWLTLIIFAVNGALAVAAVFNQFSFQKLIVFSVLLAGVVVILSLLWKILRLLKVQSPKTPEQIAKKISLVAICAVIFSLVDTFSGLWLFQMSLSFSSLMGLLRPIVWFLVWSSYFKKSKRVNSHYGVGA